MHIRDAIERLDGHVTVMTVTSAKKICQALDLPFGEKLIMSWESSQQAWEKYQFIPVENGPGEGVDGLKLSYHITEHLGLGKPGYTFTGVGFQARANRQAICQKLSELGKL